MIGAICRNDILSHPMITVRCFGLKLFFRALVAGGDQTFLSLVAATNGFRPVPGRIRGLVDRCIGLELCARRIYESLARSFERPGGVADFFATLAHQESCHAELLDVCRAATGEEQWDEKQLEAWRELLSDLEARMQDAESRAGSLASLPEALRLVLRIESSEINRLFLEVLGASDSEFVRALRVFREVGREHIAYVCERIPALDDELREACRSLTDQYARALAPA